MEYKALAQNTLHMPCILFQSNYFQFPCYVFASVYTSIFLSFMRSFLAPLLFLLSGSFSFLGVPSFPSSFLTARFSDFRFAARTLTVESLSQSLALRHSR